MRAARPWELLLLGALTSCAAVPAPPRSGVAVAEDPPGDATQAVPRETSSQPVEPAGDSPGGASLPIHGQLSTRLRHRSRSGERDDDFYATLALDIGDGSQQRVTGHVMGRFAADSQSRDPGDVLYDTNDTWDSSLTGKLYYAYADVHRVPNLDLVRLGRQQLLLPALAAGIFAFDGARLESEEFGEAGLSVGLYGGQPAHFYTSTPGGDQVLGAFAQIRPWKSARMRADWLHLEDQVREEWLDDDLYGISLWQALGDRLLLEGRYDRLGDSDRDVSLGANWYDLDTRLQVHVNYYELLQSEAMPVVDFDPLSSTSPVLHDFFPYSQGSLLVSKGVTETIDLSTGADLRRVHDSGDEGPFNRDYERYFASLGLRELTGADLSLTINGDLWDADNEVVTSLGAELEKAFDEGLSLGVGSYYSLYKYDLLLDRERDDVRTWFAKARMRRSSSTTVDLSYEYEEDEQDDYHVVRLGARWQF